MDKRVLKAIDLHLSSNIVEAKKSYLDLLDKLNGFDLETVFINLGNIYFQEKEYLKAKEYYEKALILNCKNEKTYFNIAMVFLSLKDLYKSKENFLEAIKLNENYLNAYINLAIVNKKLEFYEESIYCFERALDLNPNESDIYYNYANVLLKTQQYNLALILLKKSLDFKAKDLHKVYYSIGLIYQNKQEYKKSLEYLDLSLRYKNDYADALFAKAVIFLLHGDFKNGWEYYSHRWNASNDLTKPKYNVSWYNGEDLKNKRILVQQEQGFGDNIQFIRYVSKLNKMGAIVYIALKEELHKLFSTIPNIHIVKDNETVNNIDYFTSLLDLPKIFYKYQDEFLHKTKYLSFIEENIFNPKNEKKLNIGFVWKGNPIHKGDKKRSIELNNFELLFKEKEFDFYSLQFDNNEDLKKYMKSYTNIYDCKNLIKDFNDTANIISKLDIVITVDTSMVHLCGALGIKTFLILSKNSEWRWLLNTDKSIWYKSIKIFRQTNTNDWKSLFEKVIFELKTIKKI